MNCYEQLDELFSLWRAEAPNEYFVEDGLMILPGKTEEERIHYGNVLLLEWPSWPRTIIRKTLGTMILLKNG